MYTENACDVIPYDDWPVGETHPDRLVVTARLKGIPAAAPERCRLLELACANATNLLPIAYHLPGAECLGVELSRRQVETGQAKVDALGIDNLELQCADVMDLVLGERRFDYIIAHGLFSWVPQPVRERVLELCRDHLAENGIAFISFNALPAWGMRGAVRQALLELTAGAKDEHALIREARKGLDLLSKLHQERVRESDLIKREIEELRTKSDSYLLHEYFAADCRAFYLREFVDMAEAFGLQYECDVAASSVEPVIEEATIGGLIEAVHDPVKIEQIADVLLFRQFRAALLTRADRPATKPGNPLELVRSSRIAGAFRHQPEVADAVRPGRVYLTLDDVELRVNHATMCAVLDRLHAAWPGDIAFDDLAAEAQGDETDSAAARESLARGLWELYSRDHLQLRPRKLTLAAEPPIRPLVTSLTRFEAAQKPRATNLMHETAELDPLRQALVQHLDGSKRAPTLVKRIAKDVENGRLQIAGGPPSPYALRSALPSLIESALAQLASLGLLVTEDPRAAS